MRPDSPEHDSIDATIPTPYAWADEAASPEPPLRTAAGSITDLAALRPAPLRSIQPAAPVPAPLPRARRTPRGTVPPVPAEPASTAVVTGTVSSIDAADAPAIVVLGGPIAREGAPPALEPRSQAFGRAWFDAADMTPAPQYFERPELGPSRGVRIAAIAAIAGIVGLAFALSYATRADEPAAV